MTSFSVWPLARIANLRQRWRQALKAIMEIERQQQYFNLQIAWLQSRSSDSSHVCTVREIREVLRTIEVKTSSHCFTRIGGTNDGGYVLASDLGAPAIVISVGVGADDSADRALAADGAAVHQFDHTIESSPSESLERITFHPLGVGGPGCQEPLRTLLELEKEAGGVLEGWLMMDVEGAEWSVLSDPTLDLSKYSQISVELHGLLGLLHRDLHREMKRCIERLVADHVVVASHVNNFAGVLTFGDCILPDVVELTLIRKDCFRSGGSEVPRHLFSPNNPEQGEVDHQSGETPQLLKQLTAVSRFLPLGLLHDSASVQWE